MIKVLINYGHAEPWRINESTHGKGESYFAESLLSETSKSHVDTEVARLEGQS
ncbi:MAG: hypothetical protein ACYS9T_04730 [Planctomycetota bacterium]|jgi:hypothetical protein